jgi:hypothetical protein
MRAVSSKFLTTLRASHTAVFRARVCTTFQTGVTPTGTEIKVTGGDVIANATNLVRSTLDLSTVDVPWPTRADSLLAPYGQEIFVERGIAYGNGQAEYVGLGYFRIDTPEQDAAPAGEIQISGQDRMAGIVDARFLAPRQFPATLTRGQLVATLIQEVYPAAVIEWDDTALRDGIVGRTVVTEDDRAQVLADFVRSLAKIGYFDYRGVFVVKSAPAVTGASAWTVDAAEDGVLVKMSRSLTRERVYNAVVATGEAGDTTPPARGVALNLDPASPTYYYGPFGPVPMFYSSPFLTTNAQALSAAQSILRQQLGLPYQVDLTSIANPALEPYDVLAVRYPDRPRNRSLLTENHVIDQARIPLTAARPLELQTREQQAVLIGEG